VHTLRWVPDLIVAAASGRHINVFFNYSELKIPQLFIFQFSVFIYPTPHPPCGHLPLEGEGFLYCIF
jgi:hypothetical protein